MKTQLDSNSLVILGKLALIKTLVDKAQVEIEYLTYRYEVTGNKELEATLDKITEIYSGVHSLTSDAISEASNAYLEAKVRK